METDSESDDATRHFGEYLMTKLESSRRIRNVNQNLEKILHAFEDAPRSSLMNEVITVSRLEEFAAEKRKNMLWDEMCEETHAEIKGFIASADAETKTSFRGSEDVEPKTRVFILLTGCYTQAGDGSTLQKLKDHSFVFRIILEYLKRVNLKDRYELKKKVGQGGQGAIFKCSHKYRYQDKRLVAKVLPNKKATKMELDALRREAMIIRSIHHDGIPTVYDYIEQKDMRCLVLPLLAGGDMFSALTENNHAYTKSGAGKIIRNLLHTVRYLHSKNIVHRDIKPENIMFRTTPDESSDSDGNCVLIDFGFAATNVVGDSLTDPVGTFPYAAPEILSGKPRHGAAVDMWSIGVVVFVMLTGEMPFGDNPEPEEQEDMRKRIINAQFTCSDGAWEELDDSSKDFVIKLLEVDSAKRMNADQALEHLWMTSIDIAEGDKPLNITKLNKRKKFARWGRQQQTAKATNIFIRMLKKNRKEQAVALMTSRIRGILARKQQEIERRKGCNFRRRSSIEAEISLRVSTRSKESNAKVESLQRTVGLLIEENQTLKNRIKSLEGSELAKENVALHNRIEEIKTSISALQDLVQTHSQTSTTKFTPPSPRPRPLAQGRPLPRGVVSSTNIS